MGCAKCDYTGKLGRFVTDPVLPSGDGPTYWVEDDCPECAGVEGEEPDIVTEGHDMLTEEDIEHDHAQHGLAAAGHLLLAEGHLRKAREKLMAQAWSTDVSVARGDVTIAIDHVRGALGVLIKKKEESCNKP